MPLLSLHSSNTANVNVLNLQRPGTADSVLSEPISPRPHTSNTLVLPRYVKCYTKKKDNYSSIDKCKMDPPLLLF